MTAKETYYIFILKNQITRIVQKMTEDEVIIRYEDNEVIGLSILNASKRADLNVDAV